MILSFMRFLSVVSAFIVFGCSVSHGGTLSDSEREGIIQELISNKDFLGIFEKAIDIGKEKSGMNYMVGDIVKSYMNKNCNTVHDIEETLEKNGFDVFKENVGKYREKTSGIEYDLEIFGTRKSPKVRFFRYKTYNVAVFIKNGKVVHIISNVYSDGL